MIRRATVLVLALAFAGVIGCGDDSTYVCETACNRLADRWDDCNLNPKVLPGGPGSEIFYAPFLGDADRLPQTGNVLITDGGREIHRELDTAALFLGSLTYRRLTGDVRVRLTVMRGGAAPVVEVTRFLGADPAEGGSSNQSVDPALQEELDRLRKQLQSRQTENAALDRRLTTLKQQAARRPPEQQKPATPKITLAQKPLALTPGPSGRG